MGMEWREACVGWMGYLSLDASACYWVVDALGEIPIVFWGAGGGRGFKVLIPTRDAWNEINSIAASFPVHRLLCQ